MPSPDRNGFRLLLTGDLHLGRCSTRLPAGMDSAPFRASTAWDRIVDLAIQQGVAALCLSGDVVDSNNRYWESVGPLERGIEKLSSRGIRTVAVAGNHDHAVLAVLAESLPPDHFTLLGRHGWERLALRDAAGTRLVIDGWSFTRQYVEQDPLNSYDPSALPSADGGPVLGMVHGDLDMPESRYAPLNRTRLREAGPDAWLLGHIHRPECSEDPNWILYPGSPQAFDPGEGGLHGPWLTEVIDGRLKRPQQIPLSSVRYDDALSIPLNGVTSPSELEPAILRAIRTHTDRLTGESGEALELISLRLELTGATPVAARVPETARQLEAAPELNASGPRVRIERVRVSTTPVINLDELALRHTAAGTVARLLLDLERTEPPANVRNLIQAIRHQLRQEELRGAFRDLSGADLTDARVIDHLSRQGRALLTQLLTQNDDA